MCSTVSRHSLLVRCCFCSTINELSSLSTDHRSLHSTFITASYSEELAISFRQADHSLILLFIRLISRIFSSLSPLSSSITPSLFTLRLKTQLLFRKAFHHSLLLGFPADYQQSVWVVAWLWLCTLIVCVFRGAHSKMALAQAYAA